MRVEPRSRHGGQALVEAVVLLVALAPALLAVQMLGRYQGIRQRVDAGARLVAFDCVHRGVRCAVVHASPTHRRRLAGIALSAPDDPVQSAASAAGGRGALNASDAGGRPLVSGLDTWSLEGREDRLDAGLAVALGAGRSREQSAAALEQGGPQRFGLGPSHGLHRFSGELEARLGDVRPWQSLGLPALRFTWASAAVSDSWNAAGTYGEEPDRFEARVLSARDPASAGAPAGLPDARTLAHLERMRAIGLEARAGEFRPAEIDVGLVPADRRWRLR